MKGYELFQKAIRELKLGPIFGNPGSTEIPMLRGTEDYILTMHDSISVGMADGLAQVTGTPRIVNLHTLPGVANSMSFIHTARLNRSPVIITSGQQDNRHAFYEPLLWHDLKDLAGNAVKYFYEVKNTDDIERSMKRAYALSMEPPAGPVFLSFPMDIMEQEGQYTGSPLSTPDRNIVDMGAVRYVSEEISKSANPVIIAGAEIDQTGAFEEVAALSAKLGIPVYAEPLSNRAPFDSQNENFAGDLSPASTAINMSLLKHDLVLVMGGEFTLYPYLPSPLLPGKKVITVTLSPSHRFGDYILSNPKLFARELSQIVERKSDFRKPEIQGENGLIAREKRSMGPNYVLQKVRKLFNGYVIVDEAISSSLLVRKNLGYSPGSYFTAKSGQLGWGLAAAAGISMQRKKVLEIVGDGSLMYTIQALWTIASYGLPVKVLVLNNDGYSILKSFSSSYYPGLENAPYLSFRNDIVALSEAFGVKAKMADPDLRELEWLAEGDAPKLLVVNTSKIVPKLFP